MLHLTREGMALATAAASLVAYMGLMKIAPHIRFQLPRFRRAAGQGVRVGGEWLTDEARLRHTHIVGATGSGKTVLLEQLIFRDLERGHGALLIDPKGDRDLFERVRKFCARIGRADDLHLLSATYSDESVRWNPCRIGNASELQSKFYNSAIYTEPHYAKACELALLRVFNNLGNRDTIHPGTVLSELQDLCEKDKEVDKTVAGLLFDLSNLVQGDWKDILLTRSGGAREVSLLDVTRRNEILFVDLPTEAQAVQSARIGRLLLQEIILISGLRKLYPHLRGSHPFSVYVDEFDAFAFPAFSTFLNKGRSSGFMIHLAHQTLSDLDRVGPAFRGQIMGNMNVRFIFRQDEPLDAEAWSRFFGTRSITRRTTQTQDGVATGMSSNREAHEFRIAPDTIKELKVGECVFSDKSRGLAKQIRLPMTTLEPTLRFPNVREPLQAAPKGAFKQQVNALAQLAQDVRGGQK